MTFAELEGLAKRSRWVVSVKAPEPRCRRISLLMQSGTLRTTGETSGAAKRALCRAVEKIREAK